jgi:hypothetical protein
MFTVIAAAGRCCWITVVIVVWLARIARLLDYGWFCTARRRIFHPTKFFRSRVNPTVKIEQRWLYFEELSVLPPIGVL